MITSWPDWSSTSPPLFYHRWTLCTFFLISKTKAGLKKESFNKFFPQTLSLSLTSTLLLGLVNLVPDFQCVFRIQSWFRTLYLISGSMIHHFPSNMASKSDPLNLVACPCSHMSPAIESQSKSRAREPTVDLSNTGLYAKMSFLLHPQPYSSL